MKYIIYRRVSTEEQADTRNGLNAQLDSCLAYIHRVDASVVAEVYSDEAISGSTGLDKRPALLGAISDLGKGDVLLVAKRDRLGRDPIKVAMIESAIARKGARVISTAGEGTEGDDPSDILMRRMIDAFAEYERLIIGSRTKAALNAKRSRKEKLGGDTAPFGYDVGHDGLLVENTYEQRALSMIRDLREQGHSLRSICAHLKDNGYRTKRGGYIWHPQVVNQLLRAA